MGQTPGTNGMSGGQIGMSLLKSGLGGLSQGLSNYGAARPQQFDFSKLQQGFQPQQPAFGRGYTPGAKKPVNPLDSPNIDPFDPSSYGTQFPRY